MSLSIDLPADVEARLRALAERRGVSLDQLIVEIANSYPADPASPRRKLAFVAAGASKHGISDQIDGLLEDGFGRD